MSRQGGLSVLPRDANNEGNPLIAGQTHTADAPATLKIYPSTQYAKQERVIQIFLPFIPKRQEGSFEKERISKKVQCTPVAATLSGTIQQSFVS